MNINILSLFLAALVPMVVGFIWYHDKVFLNQWLKATGMTKEKMNSGNMLLIFGGSFICALILAWSMVLISYHDAFIGGAMFYATNKTMIPEAGSELAKWHEYYMTNLAPSNRTFAHGAFHGAMIGGILITTPIIITESLYEQRGWKFMAIKAGYWIICLSIMGGIIASMA